MKSISRLLCSPVENWGVGWGVGWGSIGDTGDIGRFITLVDESVLMLAMPKTCSIHSQREF